MYFKFSAVRLDVTGTLYMTFILGGLFMPELPSIISIPNKNLPGKCCGQRKKKYSLTHDASSLLNFTFTECQS